MKFIGIIRGCFKCTVWRVFMKIKPLVTNELIEILRELYPDRVPRGLISTTKLSYIQGQQSVIDKLYQMLEDDLTNEN